MRMSPIGSDVSLLGAQWVVLFGHIMKPLEGAVYLKEVHHWGGL